MAKPVSEQLLNVFDYCEQPIFFIKDGKVHHVNRAAQAHLVAPGQPLRELLGEHTELFEMLEEDQPIALTVFLEGKIYPATAHQTAAGRCFTVNLCRLPQTELQTLVRVSQSIRTPLTNLFAVSGEIFPLLEETESPQLHESAAQLNRGFYQLLHVASNLTELQYLRSDEISLSREQTELGAFLDELTRRLQPLCLSSGYEVRFVPPQKQIFAWIDRKRVHRALLNLISNAFKFSPEKGTVYLELSRNTKDALLSVRDEGEGMDAGTLSAAFTRFDRLPQLDDSRWGVGLGLPLSLHIAQQHGGTLMLQSLPGQGATATMALPLARPSEAERTLRSPLASFEYSGGFQPELIELADLLPAEAFRPIDL